MSSLLTLDQSRKLKEIGYSEPTDSYYRLSTESEEAFEFSSNGLQNHNERGDRYLSRPTVYQFLVWCRTQHGLYGWVQPEEGHNDPEDIKALTVIWFVYAGLINECDFWGDFDTYESAEEALIDALIEILKNKKQ